MNNMKQTQDDRTIQPFSRSTIQRVKAYAFTLAETLIVIGIIGVVAALTLPNLNHATGDKEKVTKVKKIYASLTDAVDRAQAIYGDFDTWFNDLDCVNDIDYEACAERFAKRVTEFMKVSKDCGFDEGCFSTAPLLLANGSEQGDCDNYLTDCLQLYYMFSLSDGTSIAFEASSCRIKVDIDGPNRGKTQQGSDIFDFSIFYNEAYAVDGMKTNQLYPSFGPDRWTGDVSNWSSTGGYETAWVIQNGNLDYLKCPEELNWDTQTSCK